MGLYNSLPTETKVDPKKVSGTFYTKKQKKWREMANEINGRIARKYTPSQLEPLIDNQPEPGDFTHA